ncbi:hypothetical protein QVD99_002826 [Batrachochytrium dendrobatidis]|nr:hypothetical protein O5D80_007050 [Batrachochytrium dendrobatidis]KAK5671065.1 hypothetical protein QVD99_002826 [Batrachochytrium dendrobatidis]
MNRLPTQYAQMAAALTLSKVSVISTFRVHALKRQILQSTSHMQLFPSYTPFRGLTATPYIQATSIPHSKSYELLTIKAKEWFNTGLDLWNKEDIAGAIEAFEKSVHSQPTSDAHFNLGNCFHIQGKHDKALLQWNMSLELLPRADAHVNIANVYAIIKQDLETATPHYEAALELTPDDGEVHYNYGVVLDASSKLELAVEHYQKARKLGVELAEKNLRNVLAKLIGQKAKLAESENTPKKE